jgi:hypothetical protein
MGADPKKTITFIQYAQPQLEDGNYSLAVEHTVSTKNQDPSSSNIVIPPTTYKVAKNYAVQGERFALSPADLISVFPPNTSLGEFYNVLPHVVLSRKTLPWERSTGSNATVNDAPWLGLIVFNEGDLIPVPTDKTLLDLLPLTQQTSSGEKGLLPADTYFPAFPLSHDQSFRELEYGESWDDKCTVIDLPIDQFAALLPSVEDLGWLAHVREVALENKSETYIKQVKKGASPLEPLLTAQMAEVVANRFPLPGKSAVVHLVSLEGFGPVLPVNGAANSTLLTGMTTVRLVSLKNWTFTSLSDEFTFAGLLLNINKRGGVVQGNTLQIPFTPSDLPGDAAVANALKMGFAAFNHRTRMGDKTVSWYHGPFVPYNIQTSIPFPGNTADDFLRYNPDAAMLDVSYSAGWQIGRLLGLQSNSFATALYNWKRTLSLDAVRQIERTLIDQSTNSILTMAKSALTSYASLSTAEKQPTKPVADKMDNCHAQPVVIRASDRLSAIRKVMTNPTHLAAMLTTNDPAPVPDVITNFLASLKLLKGVPFNYLVPDERMLPQESLRFFYLDTAWVDAMLEGALSIGNSTTGDGAMQQVISPGVHQQATRKSLQSRRNLLGIQPQNADPITPTFNPTGFFLRSEVVTGWPGLEVKGYDDTNTLLDMLRMDHVGPGVLLCIFNGIVQTVDIQEHPEALHFGVDIDPNNGRPDHFTKSLRYIDAVGSNVPGSKAPITPLPIPKYVVGDTSVLKTNDLATDIGKALLNGIHYQGAFTSAEFALEMVEGVDKVTFTFKG